MRKIVSSLLLLAAGCATLRDNPRGLTADEVIAAAPDHDWFEIPAEDLLLVDTPRGRIVIALAPEMAIHTVENVRALARSGFYDGLAFIRAQEDYVAQWGDADGTKPITGAEKAVKAEFTRTPAGLDFYPLPEQDTYAPEAGFIRGFPAARGHDEAWLVHCYGMVGVGRDEDADSGSGSDLYMVIGHPPRHLDRNVTLIGRVVEGMSLISTLPRGSEKMGFYATAAERTALERVRVVADLPEGDRPRYRTLRSDSTSFADLIEARRNRRDPWTKHPAGKVDVCNVPNPTQAIPRQ
jgi:peptidylprolyl isomerase